MRKNNETKEGINKIRNSFFKNSLIKYKTSKETDLQMREREKERERKRHKWIKSPRKKEKYKKQDGAGAYQRADININAILIVLKSTMVKYLHHGNWQMLQISIFIDIVY